MRITDIQVKTVSIASEIRNAFIDFSKMTVSVAALHTDIIKNGKPIIGYGFNSNGRYDQTCLLRERFIPRLMDTEPADLLTEEGDNLDPFKIWNVMMTNEKPGGHGERSVAVGVIDMAVWDAVAKMEEKPLYQLLSERYNDGNVNQKVFVYAAGGYYYPGKELGELQNEIQSYLEQGYSVVKIKIGGTELNQDIKRIESVLKLLDDGKRLAVDANGRFGIETAIQYAQAMEPYNLRWYEEPGDPLDYALHEELGKHYSNPMSTGENLFSIQDVRNLLRYAGLRPHMDILQMDPALSYGLVEYLRMLDALKEHGWSPQQCIPHGGHQFALNIAAGLGLGGNESYPKVFAPFGGFADNTPVENSYITLPDVPGIGFEMKSKLMDLFYEFF